WAVIKHPAFLKNLGYLVAFMILFLLLTSQVLNCYTNHGQKLTVPDLVNMNFEEAREMAEEKSFELILADSIFVLNEEPQLILNQNPLSGSKVKEGRKIYVTISKVLADLVKLPDLTGGNDDFNQYSRKLDRIGVTPKISDRRYSIRLARNTILEVHFQGDDITEKLGEGFKVPMGSIVEFVVSDRSGGRVSIPNLVCMNFEEASFLTRSTKVKIGKVTLDKSVTEQSTAFVIQQNPSYSPSAKMDIGATIDVVLSQNRPKDCGGDDYREAQKKKKDNQ
ncbi:MAG: PASTA domain-containing protein, partial [Saprospiraceae bacterium]|nr:PASTA domain-containing protein [Saprospiraceae bacterium]